MLKTRSKKEKNLHHSYGAAESEVLTLAEAARFLRVSEEALLQSVTAEGLPGRKVGEEWRFLRSALKDWLKGSKAPSEGDFWRVQLGAFKDDPDLDAIVREAYRKRGRPVEEAG